MFYNTTAGMEEGNNMTLHERIEQEVYDNGITLDYTSMPGDLDGLIISNHLIVNSSTEMYAQNTIMRHELEHFYTNPYNLMSAPSSLQSKMEAIADRRSVYKLVPIDALVRLYESGIRSADELSDALEVDMPFIYSALMQYRSIYGYDYRYHGRIINFLPLEIRKEAL